jgi:malate dehydrogenase (quinone)
MIEVIERCYKQRMKSAEWKNKMKEMIPSYGESLDDNVALLHEVRDRTLDTLGLEHRASRTAQKPSDTSRR